MEQQEHCQRGALPFRGLHEALPCCASGPTALEEATIAHIVTAKCVPGDRKHHITLLQVASVPLKMFKMLTKGWRELDNSTRSRMFLVE